IGLWLKKPSFAAFGPFHTCGHADEFDVKNFRYFEPYKRTDIPFTKCCYRYYGNGWLEWKPNPLKGELEEFAAELTNLKRESAATGLVAVEPGMPARILIPVKSPYAVVKVELDLKVEQEEGSWTAVTIRDGEKKGAQIARIWERRGALSGMQTVTWTNDAVPLYLYEVLVDSSGGKRTFDVLRLKTVFQLNWAALPSLHPGENVISVTAAEKQNLKETGLRITWEWDEGPGWTTPRTATEVITELPSTYKLSVDIPPEKMPRMKRLVLKLE
ncbi:MAG: hypothetical protein ACUVTG_17110, partial [Candidatus Oleimicrobiaceae bacterium]